VAAGVQKIVGRTAIVAAAFACAALAPGAGAALRPGDILAIDQGSTVYQVDAQTGDVDVFSQDPAFFGTGGLAFTPEKRVIATDESESAVFSLSPTGAIRPFLDQGLSSPFGVAYSPVDGILVADYERGFQDTGQLLAVRRDDFRILAKRDKFLDPIGVAVASTGVAYVIEQDGRGGAVLRIKGRRQPVVTNGDQLDSPTDGVVGPDGTIYVSDQAGLAVAVNPRTGAQDVLASDPTIEGGGIALGFDGLPIVAALSGPARVLANGTLEEIAPTPTVPTDVAVVPPACGGRWASFYGTEGRDRIKGSAGKDVIAGLGGNDVIRTRGGKDIVCGGDGRDDLDGGVDRDVAIGGAGNDDCRAERRRSC
jgi:hypothetical protein